MVHLWDLTYLFNANTEVTVLMRKLGMWDCLSSLRLCVVWNGGGFRKAFCNDFCPGLRRGLALEWFWVYLLYFLPTELPTVLNLHDREKFCSEARACQCRGLLRISWECSNSQLLLRILWFRHVSSCGVENRNFQWWEAKQENPVVLRYCGKRCRSVAKYTHSSIMV